MLRTKNKSVLHILLALVMLVGVAVLVMVCSAPKAEAATAGQYEWRIVIDSDNDTGGWGTDSINIYGCKNNGTSSQTSSAIASNSGWKIDFDGNRYNTLGCASGDSKSENCPGITTDEFPTKFTYWFSINSAWADRNLKFTAYLQVKNSSGTWVNVPWNCSYANETGTSASINGQYINVTIDSSFTTKARKGTITYTVPASSKPKASSITGGSGFSAKTVTANATGGAAVNTSSAAATVKDQFGVNWYQDPQWTITDDNWGGVTVNTATGGSTTASVPATSSTTTTKTFKLKAYRGDANSSITVTVQPTYKINYDTTTHGGAANSYTAGTQVNTSSSSTKVNFKIPSGNKPAASDGWEFNGWATTIGASSGVIPDDTKTIEIDNYNDTIYATYKKTLTVNYHYYSTSGAATKAVTKDIYNHAESGTVTAAQVTEALGFTAGSTKVTYNNVEYTFQGWRTDTSNSIGSGLSTNGQYAVQANAPTVERYAVYTTTNTAHEFYYNASGVRTSRDSTGDPVVVNVGNSNKPTQASFTLTSVNPSTVTIDGRTFTFRGWRTDNANEAVIDKNANDVVTRNFKKAGYNYYAVYSADVTLSYNGNQRFSDGSDTVIGTVSSNKTTQYAVANSSSAANAKRTTPAIAVNPGNVQLSRVGADEFIGWNILTSTTDPESETAAYPVTRAADAANALTIDTNTTLLAVYRDSRKTVAFLNPSDGSAIDTLTIRYNYGSTATDKVPVIDPNEIADHKDGTNHYYFTGWSQNAPTAGDIAFTGDPAIGYSFTKVRDNVSFTAQYIGQAHHWAQDDLATEAVSCNGVEGEGHALAHPGSYHRYCTECGYGENDTVGNYSPNTHVVLEANVEDYLMVLNSRPATCTTKGSTGRTVCTLCFKTVEPARDIDPKGIPVYEDEAAGIVKYYKHDMRVTEETDTYIKKACAICDHTETLYKAGTHTLTYFAAAPATCTEDGYTVSHFYCEDCGKRFEDFEASVEITEDVVLPASGHDWQLKTEAKAATCTENGYRADAYVCGNCGALQDEANDLIPATGHDWGEWTVTQEGDCTENPKIEQRVCANDPEHVETRETAPTGHKLGGLQIDLPTCFAGGRSYRVCEKCGDYTEVVSVYDALGHSMELKAGKAATCTAAGVKDYYECVRCHRITSDAAGENVIENVDEWKAIDPLGHDLGEAEVKDPTCTEKGYSIRYCTRTGCTYSERTDGEDALGHTGGAATCQAKAVCERCGRPYGSYAAHTWDGGVLTPGTCQQRAVTTYTCTVEGCGTTKVEKGGYGTHDYWTISQTQPTCTEKGVTVRRCAVCGDEQREEVDALGHDVADWTLEGTEAKGTCRRCGQTVTTTPAAAGLTHKCEKCGLVHEGRTGIFVEDGLYCKLIGFFRRIFSMFG